MTTKLLVPEYMEEKGREENKIKEQGMGSKRKQGLRRPKNIVGMNMWPR